MSDKCGRCGTPWNEIKDVDYHLDTMCKYIIVNSDIARLTKALSAMTAERDMWKGETKSWESMDKHNGDKIRQQTANKVLDEIFQMNGPSRAITILRKKYSTGGGK